MQLPPPAAAAAGRRCLRLRRGVGSGRRRRPGGRWGCVDHQWDLAGADGGFDVGAAFMHLQRRLDPQASGLQGCGVAGAGHQGKAGLGQAPSHRQQGVAASWLPMAPPA